MSWKKRHEAHELELAELEEARGLQCNAIHSSLVFSAISLDTMFIQ